MFLLNLFLSNTYPFKKDRKKGGGSGVWCKPLMKGVQSSSQIDRSPSSLRGTRMKNVELENPESIEFTSLLNQHNCTIKIGITYRFYFVMNVKGHFLIGTKHPSIVCS